MRSAAITASEKVDDIITECQTLNAPNVNQGNSVRARVLYHSNDIVAVRHNSRREPSPYWLAILLDDVCVEVDSEKFVKNRINIQWLNLTDYALCYVRGDTCNNNSPKCIMTESHGILFEDDQFQVPAEEDIRLRFFGNKSSKHLREQGSITPTDLT
jgi:hypothetical protein